MDEGEQEEAWIVAKRKTHQRTLPKEPWSEEKGKERVLTQTEANNLSSSEDEATMRSRQRRQKKRTGEENGKGNGAPVVPQLQEIGIAATQGPQLQVTRSSAAANGAQLLGTVSNPPAIVSQQ